MSAPKKWGLLITVALAIAVGAVLPSLLREADGQVMTLPPSYSDGLQAAEQGDWSAAAHAFEAAAAADPNAPPLLFALGTAYAESGQRLRAAVYLNAYLEAWPDAPNVRAVKARIKDIVTPFHAAARDMAAEAVEQLDGIVDDEARALRSRAMAARLIDLGPGLFDDFAAFAQRHASGLTSATMNHLIARGTIIHAPEEAYALLATAIEAESDAAAQDIRRAGCADATVYAAPEVCSEVGLERAQACYNAEAGVGSTRRRTIPGNRAAFARHLDFYAAAYLWVNGADHETIVRRLADAYAEQNARLRADAGNSAFSPMNCGFWPGKVPGTELNIIYFADGSGMEAWSAAGRVEVMKPAPSPPAFSAPPTLRPWRNVIAERRIEVGPERLVLAFDDVTFGDLSSAVRIIGREPPETRPELLSSLALKLGLLVQRLDPP
jgi:tetratricopeptide (TPR) repeat protein